MGHAFRAHVHRHGGDHDGEYTLVFKVSRQYYDEAAAVGKLTQREVFVTVLTEEEVQEGAHHEET